MIQLGDNGMPARALYGPLRGPIQTVSKALQAVRHLPCTSLGVSDLLGLVQEVGLTRKLTRRRHALASGAP
eukprot:9367849-Pyramimonas_sp.AAC.1